MQGSLSHEYVCAGGELTFSEEGCIKVKGAGADTGGDKMQAPFFSLMQIFSISTLNKKKKGRFCIREKTILK
jgi:hypothetical protein